MDVSSHLAHRRHSESALVSRDNRRLSLELDRVQSVQDILIKNIDKEMNILQEEIKTYGYSMEEKKKFAAEKFPIYLPFWKELKWSGPKRQADMSRNREINISKIYKRNVSVRDKIRHFIQNISRVEETTFINNELVTEGRAQGQSKEQLLSINPSAVGIDSNIASEFSTGEELAVLRATDCDEQTENINKKSSIDTFLITKKPDEFIKRPSPVIVSTCRQYFTPLPYVHSDTLLSTHQKGETLQPVLPSVDDLRVVLGSPATQESDLFCSGITKKTLHSSEFSLQDITENQHIVQSGKSTVSAVDDKMSTKKTIQRRSSIIASPGELDILLQEKLKISENNGHFPQIDSHANIKTTRRHSVLPNLEKFNERRQSDGSIIFKMSQTGTPTSHSPRSESEGSDIRKVSKKPEHKRRKSLVKNPVFDRELYNADGSLRTIHCLPSFEESWKQAQQARYIRSNYSIEKEIPIEDMFSVNDKVNVAESDTNTES